MIEHLDRSIQGQADAKRALAVAVYNHYLARAYSERNGTDLGRHHLLLIGPTGVGKTVMVKAMAAYLQVPIGHTSAAGLVEAGYKGASVETVVSAVLESAGGDVQLAERGIVFIDEIDKIHRSGDGGRDVSGEGVQNALLTLMDGRISKGYDGYSHAAVDTGRLLFICSGAFVALKEIIAKRLGMSQRNIGFNPEPGSASGGSCAPDLSQVETEDLVSFGMIPELVGRFSNIGVLHELDQADLRHIVGKKEDSALGRQKTLAAIHGIQLDFTDAALDAIATTAARLGTGARALTRLTTKAVWSVGYRWPELAASGIRRVVIHPHCLAGQDPELFRDGTTELGRIDGQLIKEALPVENAASAGARLGFTNTAGWSEDQIRIALSKATTDHLDWGNASGPARQWWTALEREKDNPALLLRLVEELRNRKASLNELWNAYLYSNTDNIKANLHYLDYVRIKKEEERRKQEESGQPIDTDGEPEDEDTDDSNADEGDPEEVASWEEFDDEYALDFDDDEEDRSNHETATGDSMAPESAELQFDQDFDEALDAVRVAVHELFGRMVSEREAGVADDSGALSPELMLVASWVREPVSGSADGLD